LGRYSSSSGIAIISLNTTNLLIISAILLPVNAFLFYLSTATFRTEEILTKWRWEAVIVVNCKYRCNFEIDMTRCLLRRALTCS